MQWLYLAGLLFSITGTGILDWRYKLAFWYDARRTVITLAIAIAVFLVWDLSAIGLGIFLHGGSPFALPFTLVPQFPVEELFFLFLLCYCALTLYRGASKLWPRI